MFVNVKGMKINYRTSGRGPSLVLIHGHGESIKTWRPNLPALAEAFTVHAFDLVGSGDSDKPLGGDYSVQGQADLLLDFMDELGIDRTVVACRSFGGKIGLKAILKAPARFEGLVLLSSAVGEFDIWPEFMAVAETGTGEQLMKLQNEAYTESVLKRLHDRSYTVTREDILDFLKPARSDETIHAFLTYFRDFMIHTGSMMDELARISIPTLIIWGANDEFISPEHGELIRERIHGSKLVLVNNAGHNVHQDQPQEVNRSIIHHFQGISE